MNHPAFFVVLAGMLLTGGGVVSAASISGQGAWESTLQARDLDGDTGTVEAWYDTVQDITWLGSGYIAANGQYGNGDGVSYASANSWASGLNVFGVTDWRLPAFTDTGASGCDYANSGTDCGYNVDTSTSELAHLFYVTLGNEAEYTPGGTYQARSQVNTNTGPFSGLEGLFISSADNDWWFGDSYFWLDAVNALAPGTSAWCVGMIDGQQGTCSIGNVQNAWAVHDGSVGQVVPVPATLPLLLSALGMLGWSVRRGDSGSRGN